MASSAHAASPSTSPEASATGERDESRPILVALLDPPHGTRGGDWYYRAYVPGRAMAERERVSVVALQNHHRARRRVLLEADVVVLNAVCDAELLPVVRERRRKGLLTVFEINDDYRALQRANPTARFFDKPENRRLYAYLAKACGIAQYSVRELQRLYGGLTGRGRVFENQLPAMPPPRERAPSERVVVGWGGSNGHYDDMAAVAPALVELLRRRDEVVLRIMGAVEICELFSKALPPGRVEHVRTGSIDDYHAFVRGLDIGMAPLLDDAFNRSRSDVKFLEYACHGVAPVVQRLVPYLDSVRDGDNGLLASSPEELVRAVETLARDHTLRERIGRGAYASVATTRLQSQHVDARLAFYREELERSSGDVEWRGSESGPVEGRRHEALLDELAGLDGASREGRLVVLGSGEFEQCVERGLQAREWQARADEAIALFDRAIELSPDDPLPWLLRGTTHPSRSDLERTVALGPTSLTGRIALGQRMAREGDLRCVQVVLEASELAPDYDVPFELAGTILQNLGMAAESEQLLQAARARRAALGGGD
jgi:glycosyltransferase involved in cell wall biosynthesis